MTFNYSVYGAIYVAAFGWKIGSYIGLLNWQITIIRLKFNPQINLRLILESTNWIIGKGLLGFIIMLQVIHNTL